MTLTSRRVLWAAALLVGCHSEIEDSAPAPLAKAVPASVSNQDAWRLFDRSTSSAFTPTAEPLRVTLGRAEQLQALKIYGSAPYRLHVEGASGTPIGFADIDLSSVGAGWHVFTSNTLVGTSEVQLRFDALGTAAPIPEIELWASDDHASGVAVDLTAKDPGRGYAVFAGATTVVMLDPGACEDVPVTIGRSPAEFGRAYLVYDAQGLFRPFAIRRAVNGLGEQGGAWLTGDAGAHTFVEEIDPATLMLGDNTVRLCAPSDATGTPGLSNVRIVGELDRGVHTVSSLAIAGSSADAHVLLDGDASTHLDIASGDRVVASFDHLIAPDALVLAGDRVGDDAAIECVDVAGDTVPLAAKPHATATGMVFELDGGRSTCAQLAFKLASGATLGEVDVVGSGAAERVDWPRIVVTSAHEHFGDVAYVGGFIARLSLSTMLDVDQARLGRDV